MAKKKKKDRAFIPAVMKKCLKISNFVENMWKNNKNEVQDNEQNQNNKCEENYSMMFEYIVMKIAQENNISPDEVHGVLAAKMNKMISMADPDMVEDLYETFGNRKPTSEEFILYLYECMNQSKSA